MTARRSRYVTQNEVSWRRGGRGDLNDYWAQRLSNKVVLRTLIFDESVYMLCSPELSLRKYWAFHKETPPAAGIAASDQHYHERGAGRFQGVASLADDRQTPR